jgi:hypothetical protein
MLAETVLATMLMVGPAPGETAYSLVAVPEGSPAPCTDTYAPRCAKPWRQGSRWVRVETWAEGLPRYWTIAQAIAEHAGSDDALARLAIATTYHESGWRRDVHAGEGPRSRGDGGESWCVGQIRTGRHPMSRVPRSELRARDLVGVDAAATGRCIGVAVGFLRALQRGCGRQAHCVFSYYVGLQGTSYTNRHVQWRVRTYARLHRKPPPLSAEVRGLLGL